MSPSALQRLEPLQVGHGVGGREVLLVRLGERVGVDLGEPGRPARRRSCRAARRAKSSSQERVASTSRASTSAGSTSGTPWLGVDADDEVQPGQHRLGHQRRVVDARAVERVEQDRLHGVPHLGRVAVARQVDQAGHEPAVVVAAQEQPQLPALLQVQHAQRGGGEVVAADLEQLVARVGLEDLQQVLARVAVAAEPAAGQHLGGLAPQHRDALDALVVRGRGEQAEEPPLPHDLAGLVEGLHPDVVEVGRAVHRGAAVGLGDHAAAAAAGPATGRRAGAGRRHRTAPGRRAGCPARCPARRPAGRRRRPPRSGARTRGSRGR